MDHLYNMDFLAYLTPVPKEITSQSNKKKKKKKKKKKP